MHSLFTEMAIIESEIKRNDYSDYADFFQKGNQWEMCGHSRFEIGTKKIDCLTTTNLN
jgi:hypothetical protein